MALVIKTELNTKKFDKQIGELEAEIKELNDIIENPKEYKFSSEEIKKAEVDVEKLTNKLIRLQEQQAKLQGTTKITLGKISNIGYNETSALLGTLTKGGISGTTKGDLTEKTEWIADNVKDLKNAFTETGQAGEEAGERSGRGFEKGIKSLKRFALSLFGIRSAFSLVRRATSTYLSQHEDTANKINAIWVALGNALGPIIEIIGNGVLKLIGYLNVFLRALGFDIDLTKNMNKSTKAINGTTKAMKELNNQVASFDEMEVAQKETSLGGIGGVDGTNDFEMPELNENVVKFLQETANLLKENWDWISKILILIAGIAIAKWLTGLQGLSGALGALATLGVIVVGVDLLYNAITGRDLINDLKEIYDGLKQLSEIEKQQTTNNKKFKYSTQELTQAKKEEAKQYKKNSKEEQVYFDYLRSIIEAEAQGNKMLAEQIEEMDGLTFWYESVTGKVDEYDNQLIDNNKNMRYHIQAMVDEYNQGKLNEEQEKQLFAILRSLNATIQDGTVKYKDMDGSVLEASRHTEDYANVVEASSKKTQTSTDSQKKAIEGLTETMSNEMSKINKLTATAQIKADASQFQETINKIGKTQGMGAILGVAVASTLANIKLARGGIINNPGKGVPLVGAIGGEATNGAEGVVPLNNEQSMDLIGQSIARHLVINLTNTTMLDNKVIAREQRKIQDETNFATNGRGVL